MEQLEMLWIYQQADMAADKLEKEIKRSPTRLKLVKCRDNCLEQQEAYKRTDSEMADAYRTRRKKSLMFLGFSP